MVVPQMDVLGAVTLNGPMGGMNPAFAHSVLSSDLGQPFNPPIGDGLALFADRLLEAGPSEHDVQTMAVTNSRHLATSKVDVAA
jgi:hypothetical protein